MVREMLKYPSSEKSFPVVEARDLTALPSDTLILQARMVATVNLQAEIFLVH